MEIETEIEIETNCLSRNHELTSKKRQVLINWLSEVADNFKLHDETLILTVYILDSYLYSQHIPIERSKFQLIGIVCLAIAALVEQESILLPNRMVAITDNTYTQLEVTKMRKHISNKMQGKIAEFGGNRNCIKLLRNYCLSLDSSIYEYAKNIVLLNMLDITFSDVDDSYKAFAAYFLAKKMKKYKLNKAELCISSSHDIKNCMDRFFAFIKKNRAKKLADCPFLVKKTITALNNKKKMTRKVNK